MKYIENQKNVRQKVKLIRLVILENFTSQILFWIKFELDYHLDLINAGSIFVYGLSIWHEVWRDIFWAAQKIVFNSQNGR